ncbi:cytochrome P450 2D15-like [Protopterus annectens]|uniref:cytochrome P450 2D15-like n=1 Tax=Protopterus annectens TaxID=7888 RepID=UPI001CFB70AC|nr:cytochrome P450 2D15-like [Protopterus annectens]
MKGKLSKKYGNIYSLQFCWNNVVVLNGFQAIKEALVKKSEDFADRPILPLYKVFGYRDSSEGLVFARYDKTWKEQRRFALTTLRNFGMGKKSVEEQIGEEAMYLCRGFQNEKGKPFDPKARIVNAVANVICSIVFGDRVHYTDPDFVELVELFEEDFKLEAEKITQIMNVFPWTSSIPGPHQRLFTVTRLINNKLQKIVDQHKETRNPAVKRDFIDAFLEEIEKANDQDSSFNESNLVFTTIDLFAAGMETTTMSLYWALLFMVVYPDIQRKVHEEIDSVLGKEKKPTSEDRINMPYTDAVIHETLRYGNIAPTSLPHRAFRDTEVLGYFIPKGTTVFVNLSSALFDETIWEKPYEFIPEHFLSTDGQVIKHEAFIPFSMGRRICLGEQLAKTELFIFFTSLMQCFKIKLPEGEPAPSLEGVVALTRSPHPYKICAEPR